MSNRIECKKGSHVAYDDFMELIDLAFGFTTPETRFLGLLPKLYRPSYRPQEHNYVVTDGDTLCAAVGAYDHSLRVVGQDIPCRGIGNVAVHPDHRGRSYMKLAMEMAVEDMVRDGVALSALGGRRQRYQYFSYDKAGPCHTFVLTSDNIRHTYGTEAPYTIRTITESTDPLLDDVKALSDSGGVVPVRDRFAYLDIAQSWHAELLTAIEPATGRFVGYAITQPNGFVTEVQTVCSEDFMPLLCSLMPALKRDSLTIRLPDHERSYLNTLAAVAEGVQTGCSMSYSVLDYGRVIRAFLTLKATYDTLMDGTLTLLIHGRARDEKLQLSVRDGEVTVAPLPPTAPVDYELTHMEAMSLLFAPFCPHRQNMSPLWRSWFPLPLWIYRADEV